MSYITLIDHTILYGGSCLFMYTSSILYTTIYFLLISLSAYFSIKNFAFINTSFCHEIKLVLLSSFYLLLSFFNIVVGQSSLKFAIKVGCTSRYSDINYTLKYVFHRRIYGETLFF